MYFLLLEGRNRRNKNSVCWFLPPNANSCGWDRGQDTIQVFPMNGRNPHYLNHHHSVYTRVRTGYQTQAHVYGMGQALDKHTSASEGLRGRFCYFSSVVFLFVHYNGADLGS